MHKKGKLGFEQYYSELFATPEAFLDWQRGLVFNSKPILRFAANYESRLQSKLQDLWHHAGYVWQTLEWYPQALRWPEGISRDTVLPGYNEHLLYPMNASSLLPVLALDPQPGETILDACAAPGGKTLMIADHINSLINKSGELFANDTSPKRRVRLQKTLQDYDHSEVIITNYKAEIMFKRYPEYFDKILVDAPCSSEKHVFNSPKHLAQWSYQRIKQLKQRQIAILSGLWLALKPGGRLVYSTCATTPEENEVAVATLLKKKAGSIQLKSSTINRIPCSPGWPGAYVNDFDLLAVCRITAQHNNDYDPMFVAVFEKE